MTAVTQIVANPEFARLAPDHSLERTKKALEANGFDVFIVDSPEVAKAKVLELIPEGAEVMTNTSRTLDETGISAEINESGRYDAIRPKFMQLYAEQKVREMRKLAGAPDYVLGSVHAVTEDGEVMIASGSGSQIGPYPYSAGKVIWVAGTHKIVRDQAEGTRRIHEHSLPLEHERMMAAHGIGSAIGKVLTLHADRTPNRSTLILIKEHIGF